jgi:hypothetical protein
MQHLALAQTAFSKIHQRRARSLPYLKVLFDASLNLCVALLRLSYHIQQQQLRTTI